MRTSSVLSALAASASIAGANQTFTKTVSFVNGAPSSTPLSCGAAVHESAGMECPDGCHAVKIASGYAAGKYSCQPEAANPVITAPASGPKAVVYHMSCRDDLREITKVVTPAYGKTWTTCATVTTGQTRIRDR
ncbi:hypothetical protein LTR86_003941 [Recurvomyces mirabilis]|nr:hypothetical protein LTR86_003941 [Recurvomyces mirabilis]